MALHNHSSSLMRLYQRMPPSLRSTAASLWGYHLQRKRFGSNADQLVSDALERDRWTAEQWKSWQEERLAYMLHRAATKVPYYREMWRDRRAKGDNSPWDRLENWPILDKETVRVRAEELVADDRDLRSLEPESTSGSTGTALTLYRGVETQRKWYSLFEARCRNWYGLSRRDRWANAGGQSIMPNDQVEPPFWVWNHGMSQLYLSVFHISPATVPHYVAALNGYKIRYLWGYPSALTALAQSILRQGLEVAPLKVVIANAEPVPGYQREAIELAFGCPLRETYGMAEIVAAANECEHGTLHLWPDAGFVECLAADGSPAAGEAGELICTGLLNEDMPLIRYRTRDAARLAPESYRCACGRALPVISGIEGRVDDMVMTQSGRNAIVMDSIFKRGMPIKKAQIIQETLTSFRIVCVPGAGYCADTEAQLRRHMNTLLGPVEVAIDPVSDIPVGRNGKFRGVISLVKTEAACAPPFAPPERELLAGRG